MMSQPLFVAVFTFNMEARAYDCYCQDDRKIARVVRKFRNKRLDPSFVARYLDAIQEALDGSLPDLLVVHLQESSITNPSNGFKSDRLIHAFLDEIVRRSPNYALVEDSLAGINSCGVIGIRSGVIVSRKYASTIRFYPYHPIFSSKLGIAEGQHLSKGSLLSVIELWSDKDRYHIWSINTHLPFSPALEGQGVRSRDQTVLETLDYFAQITETRPDDDLIKFYAGDLNYRMDFGEDTDAKDRYLSLFRDREPAVADLLPYRSFDQLRGALDHSLIDFREGVDGEGPKFLPTYKLQKSNQTGRKYLVAKGDQPRIPSWCDRILSYGNVDCLLYDSFDFGTTRKSDHRPVLGVYQAQPSEDATPSMCFRQNYVGQMSLDPSGISYGITRSCSRTGSLNSAGSTKTASVNRLRRFSYQFDANSMPSLVSAKPKVRNSARNSGKCTDPALIGVSILRRRSSPCELPKFSDLLFSIDRKYPEPSDTIYTNAIPQCHLDAAATTSHAKDSAIPDSNSSTKE